MPDAPEAPPAPAPLDPEEYLLRRWRATRAAQPGNRAATVGIGRSLAALGRIDELIAYAREVEGEHRGVADQMLRFGISEAPAHTPLGIAYCETPARRGDKAESLSRWVMLRRRQPDSQDVHLGFIATLLEDGQLAEAERAAHEALGRFGGFAPLREMQARVRAAREEAGDSETVADAANPSIPSIAGEDKAEIKALLTGFESLGSNCELGLLQRKYGAEPLGLLRFASTSPLTLLHLLRTKFAGLGEAETMHIARGGRDVRIGHALSAWTMHIPHLSESTDLDKTFRDQVRNAGFLRKKLIADLARQTKIFVYQQPKLTDAMIAEIHAAMRAYGPARLLCVRLASDEHPAGEIRTPGEDLMVAAIDRFGTTFPGAGWRISQDYWVYFCRAAVSHFG